MATTGDYYLVIEKSQRSKLIRYSIKTITITPSIQTDQVSIGHREREPNHIIFGGERFLHNKWRQPITRSYTMLLTSIFFKYSVEAPGTLSFDIKPENSSGSGTIAIRASIKDSSMTTTLASKVLFGNYSEEAINLAATVGITGDDYLVIEKSQDPAYAIFDKDYQITPRSTSSTGGSHNHSPQPRYHQRPLDPDPAKRLSPSRQQVTRRFPDLTPGDYTITWGDVPNWTKPSPASATLVPGGSIIFSGTYVVQVGSLTVMISPQAAIDAGGQWRRTGTTPWLNAALPNRTFRRVHTVEFKTVTGCVSKLGVTISNGATTTASGTYVVQVGSLTVTISSPGRDRCGCAVAADRHDPVAEQRRHRDKHPRRLLYGRVQVGDGLDVAGIRAGDDH